MNRTTYVTWSIVIGIVLVSLGCTEKAGDGNIQIPKERTVFSNQASTCEVSLKFREWGTEALDVIERDFRIPNSDDYYNDEQKNQISITWGNIIQMWALAAAADLEPEKYQRRLERFIAATDKYWSPNYNGIAGYSDMPLSIRNDRYYDDNSWMALGLIESYKVTRNKKYLQRAKESVKFCFSGEDTTLGGGIWWKETWNPTDQPKQKATCSTAGAALAALELYGITGDKQYLDDGSRLLQWLKDKMQDEDGLFFNDIKPDGTIGTYKWSYNSAIPLQCYILLYKYTGEYNYIIEAQRLAAAAEKYWYLPGTGTINDPSVFAFTLLDAWLKLYEVDKNPRRLDIVKQVLTYVHEHVRDSRGQYPKWWYETPDKPLKILNILRPTSVACIYWRAACYQY